MGNIDAKTHKNCPPTCQLARIKRGRSNVL